MTDIARENIIKRWNMIASSDLGSWITEPAKEYAEFFKEIASSNFTNKYRATDFITSKLRGFAINAAAEYLVDEEDMNLVMCLDLHNITMSDHALYEFDSYLMENPCYSGCSYSYFDAFQMIWR